MSLPFSSFSFPLRSSSEKIISLKSFFQPTKSLPSNQKAKSTGTKKKEFRRTKNNENIDTCLWIRIVASLLDIHQKGFDRCLKTPLEVCLVWSFVWFWYVYNCDTTTNDIKNDRKNRTRNGLDPPLQVPRRANPTRKPHSQICRHHGIKHRRQWPSMAPTIGNPSNFRVSRTG